MSWTIARRLLLPMQRQVLGKSAVKPNMLQQVRQHAPIVGPPRYPISGVKLLIFGVGQMIIMMIIPTWALLSLPRWAAMHKGVPFGDEQLADNDDGD